LREEVKRLNKLVSLKTQELENVHELFRHNEDTLKKKELHLDRSFQLLSERDVNLERVQTEAT